MFFLLDIDQFFYFMFYMYYNMVFNVLLINFYIHFYFNVTAMCPTFLALCKILVYIHGFKQENNYCRVPYRQCIGHDLSYPQPMYLAEQSPLLCIPYAEWRKFVNWFSSFQSILPQQQSTQLLIHFVLLMLHDLK